MAVAHPFSIDSALEKLYSTESPLGFFRGEYTNTGKDVPELSYLKSFSIRISAILPGVLDGATAYPSTGLPLKPGEKFPISPTSIASLPAGIGTL